MKAIDKFLSDVKDKEFPNGMKVLVVDDDPVCLRDLVTMLRKCNYNVTMENKATRALQLLIERKIKFDLVICDVVMPDMDGFQFLEGVKREMDHVPVVLMSSYDHDRIMKAIEYGACDFLVKPVPIQVLRTIWQHVVPMKNLKSSHNQDKPLPRMGNSDQNRKLVRKRKTETGSMNMNPYSVNELGKIHSLTGPGQFESSGTFRSIPPSWKLDSSSGSSGIPDRLNSPAVWGMSMPSIPSSGTVPLRHGHISDQNANWCMLQGMPRSNEHDHLPPKRTTMGTSDLKTADGITTFPHFSSGFGWTNSPRPDHSWSNSFPLGDQFKQPTRNPRNLSGTLSRMTLQDGNVYSLPPLPNQLQGSEAYFEFHAAPMNKNPGELIRSAPQDWEGLQHPYRSYASNSLNPTIPIGGGGVRFLGESLDPTNRMFHGNTELDSPGQSDLAHPFPMITNEVQGSAMQSSSDPKGKGKQKRKGN